MTMKLGARDLLPFRRFFRSFLLGMGLVASLVSGSFVGDQDRGRHSGHRDPQWISLFTIIGPARRGADAVAPQAARYQTVMINPLLTDENEVKVGDLVFISAFEDAAALGTVDRVVKDINGVVTVRARIQGSGGYLLLSSAHGRSLGRLLLPESREFEISCLSGGPAHIIQEFAPGTRIALPDGPALQPPSSLVSESAPPSLIMSQLGAANIQIDCLIVYTPSARDYADAGSGINNFIAQAMGIAQLCMDNSAVDITMHLVHSALIDYKETGNSSTDLGSLWDPNDGYMDEVHAWRSAFRADLIHLFTKTEDFGGLAYCLNQPMGDPGGALSLARVQQVSWTTTTAHEMGHNMGCGHFNTNPSLGKTGLFAYSGGWRWTGKDGNKYCSVMTYWNELYDGGYPTPVEYFSNPNVLHQGTPTGDPAYGDNARTLREIKAVIADYRTDTSVTISGKVTEGTTGLYNVEMMGFPERVETNTSGEYAGTVPGGWSGVVTPRLIGYYSSSPYSFSPATRAYNNVTAHQIGQDYLSTILVPRLALSRKSLSFGAALGGVVTSPQRVVISNSGVKTLSWVASSLNSWLTASPEKGSGTQAISISCDPTGLGEGVHSGWIMIFGAFNSPQYIDVKITVYPAGGSRPPFGEFSTPLDAATGITGAIPVTGWVLDDIETLGVEIKRDPAAGDPPAAIGLDGKVFIGNGLFVEGPRPDIEIGYPNYPMSYKAGWGYMLLTNFLPNHGNGIYKLYAIATDKEGNQVTLGTKTITCDNAHAVKPFGTIDTPGQGGTASGNKYVNFGWVLTPLPGTVPKDGHLITVYVDSVLKGNLSGPPNLYNAYRSDVSNNFPGLNNTGGPGPGQGGPVGAFFLDTTGYANGVHTIFWIAYDDLGQGDGIGSRFFSIANVSGAPEPAPAAQESAPGDLSALPISFSPLMVKTGFDLKAEFAPRFPDKDGCVRIEISEVNRVEIDLRDDPDAAAFKPGRARYEGYLNVRDELRPLPVGSTLDRRNGRFSWMPGPGFLGTYDLVFIGHEISGIRKKAFIKVTIRPK